MPIVYPPSYGVPLLLRPTVVLTSGSPLTGTTNEAVGWYINVPGGLLGSNGFIQFEHLWDTAAGGAASSLILLARIVAGTSAGTTGGTAFINSTAIATIPARWGGKWIVSNLGAANSQTMLPTSSSSGSTTAAAVLGAVDTASDFTFSLNGKLGNSGDTAYVRFAQAIAWPRG